LREWLNITTSSPTSILESTGKKTSEPGLIRLQTRRTKAAALAPRPLEQLRPAVRCQTIRYNHRTKTGKGFTLAEIKAAGLGAQFARSIGIAVDNRRINRNQESLELNKNRLLNYINKLVLFPRNEKTPVTKAKSGILNDTPKVSLILL
jgi:large subunit ribosomal protein L13e